MLEAQPGHQAQGNLLLFGGRKIPEVAKGLGEGIRNFKNALKGDDGNKPGDDKKQA